MTLDELFGLLPAVVSELTLELLEQVEECRNEDEYSQQCACCLLAVRTISIYHAMGKLLNTSTLDSWDILMRGLQESNDLLMTFRFDDEPTRERVKRWFSAKGKDTWKPDHRRCDDLVKQYGGAKLRLGKRWGTFSGFSHPTHVATHNSVVVTAGHVIANKPNAGLLRYFEIKRADYANCLWNFIICIVAPFNGLIPLGYDLQHMPLTNEFLDYAQSVVRPIIAPIQDKI